MSLKYIAETCTLKDRSVKVRSVVCTAYIIMGIILAIGLIVLTKGIAALVFVVILVVGMIWYAVYDSLTSSDT